MNEQKFYELMGEIDPEIIAAADRPVPLRKKRGFKIALIAAVLAFAILLVPITGAFALVIGYNALDPDVDFPNVGDTPNTDQDGKPTGLIGELFGNVNWGNIWDALQGKPSETIGENGHVFEAVKLDDGTMKITKFVNHGNETLVFVPETIAGAKVSVIGEGAFRENPNISHVSLPATVTMIEDHAFYACTNLVSVDLSINIQKIGDYAFSDCTYLSSINLPYALRTLGDNAFANTALTKITIRPTLTNWGSTPFFCSGLQSVEIMDGVKTIPDRAFANCELLEVTVPGSVTHIGELAFGECSQLSKITLNDGLLSIGRDAFYGTAISELVIPATVTNIGDLLFENCDQLSKVKFRGDAPEVDDKKGPEATRLVFYYPLGATGFDSEWFGVPCKLMPCVTQPYVTECGLETVPFYAELMLGTSGTSYFEGDALVLNSYKQFQAISKKISSLYETDITFDGTYFEQFSIVLIKVTHSSSEDIIGVAGLAHDQRKSSDSGENDYLYPVITVDSPEGTDSDILFSYIAVAITTTDSTYTDARVFVYNLNPENQGSDSVFHEHFPDAFVTLD